MIEKRKYSNIKADETAYNLVNTVFFLFFPFSTAENCDLSPYII